ncbi:uncharacterized protein SOCE26_017410 [Sorangium cellulosum]|uniref:Uncharacterized protein n=1 Tax=Sorangium cellulosum TaxID=56 RepID=A0A2L0EM16_SORCE|nr:hypothetical protein [Sorangium cellulosum]AUX40341.1 uncharacterized protein SOCE26_017410 [Sorangium cellulosum]
MTEIRGAPASPEIDAIDELQESQKRARKRRVLMGGALAVLVAVPEVLLEEREGEIDARRDR